MPYVAREGGVPGTGTVIGQYARPQPGKAEEWLDDGHADLQPTLVENQTAKKLAIDLQTRTLLKEGFAYAGKQFSLSLAAQSKLNLVITSIERGNVTDGSPTDFPISASALDDTRYEIEDAADAQAMWVAMVDRLKKVIPEGTDLKQDVLDAADQTALDLVVDNRT